ncbi:MAG: hypothetical protein K2M69_02460 [Muribaculaceae bacterium]|nr:hypothetical protein [Muribaculaceae bacterium]
MENILQFYDTLRAVYNRSAISFKIFNVRSFAEIAMAFRVMLESSDIVYVFCEERDIFHKDYYDEIRSDQGPAIGEEVEGIMTRTLLDFSRRKGTRLKVVMKTCTCDFFESLIIPAEDFLRMAEVSSFSNLNRFKGWATQLPPFAFTEEERIWVQYRYSRIPIASGYVTSDPAFVDHPISQAETFALLEERATPIHF